MLQSPQASLLLRYTVIDAAGSAVGNSWRTSPDIAHTWQSVLYNLDSVVGLSVHAGPGAWNDPDMLQVGNSYDLIHHGRERVHFGLWALVKAPLLIGADLRKIRRKSLELLKNPRVLAINQDPMGVAGDLIQTHGSQQVRSLQATSRILSETPFEKQNLFPVLVSLSIICSMKSSHYQRSIVPCVSSFLASVGTGVASRKLTWGHYNSTFSAADSKVHGCYPVILSAHSDLLVYTQVY